MFSNLNGSSFNNVHMFSFVLCQNVFLTREMLDILVKSAPCSFFPKRQQKLVLALSHFYCLVSTRWYEPCGDFFSTAFVIHTHTKVLLMNVESGIHYLQEVGLSPDHRASRINPYWYFCTQEGPKYSLPLKMWNLLGLVTSKEERTAFAMHSMSPILCKGVYVLGGGCRAVEITHHWKTKICNMMDLMSALTRPVPERWIPFSESKKQERAWLQWASSVIGYL